MFRSTALVVAAALAGVLAGGALAPATAAEKTFEDLPGVDTSALSPAQREVLQKVVTDEFCYCGCPHTLAGCLREHRSCKHAPRMASLAARMAGQGLTSVEILKVLTDYYSSFDKRKRAHLDLKEFGPPQGKPEAPVTLVEFSDFTCPYCQALKPELDRFVHENGDRVKLYYKPFPLPSHARSMEAAMAGEWARGKGLFWKMYDILFAHPHELSDDDLAAHARAVGGDPDDLLKAIESGRDRGRIQASQAEARAAGLLGTPTLFFDGRRLSLPMAPRDAPEMLRFTLDDEEEWVKNGGWARD
jgi:protein-disulfide isomerase